MPMSNTVNRDISLNCLSASHYDDTEKKNGPLKVLVYHEKGEDQWWVQQF